MLKLSVDGWQLNGTETPIQNLLNRIYCDADRLRSWFYSRIGSAGCVQDFIFYSDVHQENEEARWVQDFLA